MQVTHKQNEDGSLNISIDLSRSDVNYLKHDIGDEQKIVKWYSDGPTRMRILFSKEAMEKDCIPWLRAKGVSVPSDDSQLQSLILAQPDYKDREAREAVKRQAPS